MTLLEELILPGSLDFKIFCQLSFCQQPTLPNWQCLYERWAVPCCSRVWWFVLLLLSNQTKLVTTKTLNPYPGFHGVKCITLNCESSGPSSNLNGIWYFHKFSSLGSIKCFYLSIYQSVLWTLLSGFKWKAHTGDTGITQRSSIMLLQGFSWMCACVCARAWVRACSFRGLIDCMPVRSQENPG